MGTFDSHDIPENGKLGGVNRERGSIIDTTIALLEIAPKLRWDSGQEIVLTRLRKVPKIVSDLQIVQQG